MKAVDKRYGYRSEDGDIELPPAPRQPSASLQLSAESTNASSSLASNSRHQAWRHCEPERSFDERLPMFDGPRMAQGRSGEESKVELTQSDGGFGTAPSTALTMRAEARFPA